MPVGIYAYHIIVLCFSYPLLQDVYNVISVVTIAVKTSVVFSMHQCYVMNAYDFIVVEFLNLL